LNIIEFLADMKRIFLMTSVLLCFVVVGFGCVKDVKPTVEQKQVIDRNAILLDARNQGLIMDTGEVEHMKDVSVLVQDEGNVVAPAWNSFAGTDYKTWTAAALADVTGGSSYGLAYLQFSKGTFRIVASFGGLVQPTDGSYYNTWLVKRGDGMKMINLGKLISSESEMKLTYASKTDLSEYDFFVVTLQSPDTTIPGEHLLEGVIR
jgi:hypothetical protein